MVKAFILYVYCHVLLVTWEVLFYYFQNCSLCTSLMNQNQHNALSIERAIWGSWPEGHGWRKAGVSTFSAHQRTIEQCAESVQSLALIRYFLNVCMLASGEDGKLQVTGNKIFIVPHSSIKTVFKIFGVFLFLFSLFSWMTFHFKPLVKSQCL